MNATDMTYFMSSKITLDNLGINYSVNSSPVRVVKYKCYLALRETDFNILLNYVRSQDDKKWLDFLLSKKYIIPFPDSKCFSNIELNNSGKRKLNRKERRNLNKRK